MLLFLFSLTHAGAGIFALVVSIIRKPLKLLSRNFWKPLTQVYFCRARVIKFDYFQRQESFVRGIFKNELICKQKVTHNLLL